eukprot:Em0010g593a
MGFSVGDRVVCSADKVLGNKPAKQWYGRLFRKELQGVVQGTEGSGRSKKYVVCFDEVATTKAFSTRSLKQLVALENDEAGPTITSLDEAAFTHNAYSDIDGRLTNDDDIESLHEVDINENNCSSDVVSSDVVSCHGVKWKVVEGVLEDWRCAPQYGAHILWGNDADELQRTPIDYWKLSFPLQLLPDIVTWTTASLPAGTSEGRRDLWSTEDGLFPAPRFGERYSLPRNRFEVLLRCLSFCPPSEAKGNDKWAPVRRLIDGFNERRVQKIYPGWQLCIDESVSSWRGKDGNFCSDGMPHVTRIDRKPKEVGCEIKNCADADTKVMLQLEIQEGAEIMCTREYVADYKLAGTAQVLRLTKPWHGSGRAISADLAFASVTSALACRKHGLHFTGLVKTATKFYPKGYMDEVEFAELGDDITLTTTVDGHNIMAHVWGDKVRKCFASTHSTTIPGRPSNKR